MGIKLYTNEKPDRLMATQKLVANFSAGTVLNRSADKNVAKARLPVTYVYENEIVHTSI